MIQRYRPEYVETAEDYVSLAMLPDCEGDAVLYSDHEAVVRKLREAISALLDATPQEECDPGCYIGNCPRMQARAALKETE